MRLGLITDVHNDFENLQNTLSVLQDNQVDRIITLGDTCDGFAPVLGANEIACTLSSLNVEGVWGNHDFNLVHEIPDRFREKFGASVFEYMSKVQPHLVIDGCYFSHKDSSIDPFDIEQLWDWEDHFKELFSHASDAFSAVDHDRQFLGHYHKWWAATPDGVLDWNGSAPLQFERGQRYVTVIAPVFEGKCAILDTDQDVLEPYEAH